VPIDATFPVGAYHRPAMGALSAPLAIVCLAALLSASAAQPARDPRAAERRAMIDDIRGIESASVPIDRRVLDAMRAVPRHAFVPPSQVAHAYENRPLPIGHGQTFSQPYIVALMTQLAAPQRDHRVLEVGTGSGYQAAVLAMLAGEVYSIEIIEPLAATARQRLRAYPNVRTRVGDGYYGWKEAAPFDAIVVTAAAGNVPPPLVAQLKPGGRMVVPVGSSFFTQRL
jgi:protein-L-isoaspartate(D-aspartate) O-methyltransferase